MVVKLDRDEARRIAVRAQLLDLPRPDDLLEVVRRLTLVQYSPTAAVAPSADLVMWSRLGLGLPTRRTSRTPSRSGVRLFELDMMIRPIEDLELLLPELRLESPYPRTREWLEANEPFRRDILERLRQDGPLSARELHDTSVFPWPSSGWTNDKNVAKMLELLMMQGDIAVSGRDESGRLWDLAERVYPGSATLSVEGGPPDAATNADCSPSGSSATAPRTSPPNPARSATQASPRSSRGYPAPGGWIPRSSTPHPSARSPDARRCSPRSIDWSTTAPARRRSSGSSSRSRCTSRRRSDAGATSRCRSCTATG